MIAKSPRKPKCQPVENLALLAVEMPGAWL